MQALDARLWQANSFKRPHRRLPEQLNSPAWPDYQKAGREIYTGAAVTAKPDKPAPNGLDSPGGEGRGSNKKQETMQQKPDEKQLEPLDDRQAQLTKRDYCCSTCWGELQLYPAPGRMLYAKCPRCPETVGYVTKAYAQRRRDESIAEAAEVRDLLRSVGVLPDESEEDAIKKLGFAF